MTKERSFITPRTIFGLGTISQIGAEAQKLSLKRVTIITTHGIVQMGIIDKAKQSLSEKGIAFQIFDSVEPEPSVATAEKALNFVLEHGSEGVIGFGGGSAMDVAKAVAVAATNNGLAECSGINKVKKPGLPLILVPTTGGTGSEATNVSVLLDQNGKKFVIYSKHLFATLAIVDPELTVSSPKEVTAHSGIDTLTHAIEAYLSINSGHMSDAAALKAMELVSSNLATAYNDPTNLTARQNMSLAALLGGIAITNAGIEVEGCPLAGAGIAHAVGLATGGKYKLPHGLSVGMVLPAAMEFLRPTSEKKLIEIAIALNTEPKPEKAIEKVRSIMKEVEVKASLSECNKDARADIDELAETSLNAKRLTANCSREIDKEGMKEIIAKIM